MSQLSDTRKVFAVVLTVASILGGIVLLVHAITEPDYLALGVFAVNFGALISYLLGADEASQ